MIWLFSDVLAGVGGIETYLDALARTLHAERRPFKVAVSLNGPTPVVEQLETLGIDVYQQKYVPGDRFKVRQRLLVRHVASRIRAGDWVYCVRQPMPGVYSALVRAVHRRGGKVAASWIFTPDFLPAPSGRAEKKFCDAVAKTDAVISVSETGAPRYREVYGYEGTVRIVRYHNRLLFDAPAPLPASPPFAVGFIGRIDIHQKNLDRLLLAFRRVRKKRDDVILNVYGGGRDEEHFKQMVLESGVADSVHLHGRYSHERDLPAIMAANHLFVYPSRFEGGPCFSLLELMQAGRYVVASPVGGIPDLYAGHPHLGQLVAPDDPGAIASSLLQSIQLIESGKVDGEKIRGRYLEHFSNDVAHRQFLEVLGLHT